MKPRILIVETNDFSAEVVDYLKGFAEVETRRVAKSELSEVFQVYDVFWFRLGYLLTMENVPRDCRCKVIVCPATGLDHIDLGWCKTNGIEVLSLKGEREFLKKIRATAELTIGLALALLRNIPDAVTMTQAGNWDRDGLRGRELYEKRIGIIGFGRLGKIVAGYFQALGCAVGIYDISMPDPGDLPAYESIEGLVRASDIVSVHVDLNFTTKGLLSYRAFEAFDKTKYLINTSRGEVLDENALLDALEKGMIGGAALDVLCGEPDVKDHALIRYAQIHSNLIITPHIGGNTYESFSRTEQFMAEKLKAHLDARG